jgi:hypothetical protein
MERSMIVHVFVLLLVVLGQPKIDGTEVLVKNVPFATAEECMAAADELRQVKPTSPGITGFQVTCADVAIQRNPVAGSI